MTVKIYHQVGHCSNWNLESFGEDQCGDGLILSPVHQALPKVEELPETVRRRALFDPQYYLPNSPKAKLSTYPFFPDQISDGFSTVNFLLLALESARQCVQFQIAQQFEGIVIPTRFVDQMTTKYFENQEELTVKPFLTALGEVGAGSPVYLTVAITAAMLIDEGFQTQMLNWITGFSEISGVYILVGDSRNTKQIRSEAFLVAYLKFVHELAEAGLTTLLGHLNTESVLFSLFDEAVLTFGSFENTRIFSLDKFIENEEERRGPKARIYLPGLLNWVRYEQAVQIRDDDPLLWSQVYAETEYAERVLAAAAEPTFNQPGLYKHHFVCLAAQIKRFSSMPLEQRFQAIRSDLKRAIDLHAQVEDMPLDLDPHGNGQHLEPWLNALNKYYRSYLR